MVRNLTVRVGELTDVFPEALEFGYQVTIQGTELEGSTLTIERVPLEATCNACRRHVKVERFLFICPECGSSDVKVERGMELEIAFIEVDDDAAGDGG